MFTYRVCPLGPLNVSYAAKLTEVCEKKNDLKLMKISLPRRWMMVILSISITYLIDNPFECCVYVFVHACVRMCALACGWVKCQYIVSVSEESVLNSILVIATRTVRQAKTMRMQYIARLNKLSEIKTPMFILSLWTFVFKKCFLYEWKHAFLTYHSSFLPLRVQNDKLNSLLGHYKKMATGRPRCENDRQILTTNSLDLDFTRAKEAWDDLKRHGDTRKIKCW